MKKNPRDLVDGTVGKESIRRMGPAIYHLRNLVGVTPWSKADMGLVT